MSEREKVAKLNRKIHEIYNSGETIESGQLGMGNLIEFNDEDLKSGINISPISRKSVSPCLKENVSQVSKRDSPISQRNDSPISKENTSPVRKENTSPKKEVDISHLAKENISPRTEVDISPKNEVDISPNTEGGKSPALKALEPSKVSISESSQILSIQEENQKISTEKVIVDSPPNQNNSLKDKVLLGPLMTVSPENISFQTLKNDATQKKTVSPGDKDSTSLSIQSPKQESVPEKLPATLTGEIIQDNPLGNVEVRVETMDNIPSDSTKSPAESTDTQSNTAYNDKNDHLKVDTTFKSDKLVSVTSPPEIKPSSATVNHTDLESTASENIPLGLIHDQSICYNCQYYKDINL